MNQFVTTYESSMQLRIGSYYRPHATFLQGEICDSFHLPTDAKPSQLTIEDEQKGLDWT